MTWLTSVAWLKFVVVLTAITASHQSRLLLLSITTHQKKKNNIKNFKCFQNKWMNLKHTTSAYIVSYYNVLCHHLWILNYYLQNIVPALKLCKKKHLKCFDFSFSFALDRYPILLKQSYFPPKFELPWMKNIINL